ncbi:hypothetical protein V2G26_018580 [Clonostachys chloroleuca]
MEYTTVSTGATGWKCKSRKTMFCKENMLQYTANCAYCKASRPAEAAPQPVVTEDKPEDRSATPTPKAS